jgi:hypothetical protein
LQGFGKNAPGAFVQWNIGYTRQSFDRHLAGGLANHLDQQIVIHSLRQPGQLGLDEDEARRILHCRSAVDGLAADQPLHPLDLVGPIAAWRQDRRDIGGVT